MSNGLGLFGVPLDNVTMQQALDRIEGFISSGGMHQVATANLDYLVNATGDQEYRRILAMCDLVLADGMPLVWASRLFGVPLPERVAGSDLVPQLARLSSEKGYRIFLLGASPENAEAAAQRMEVLNPGVQIVGKLSPPIRPIDEFDNGPILEAIERARTDILLVAFGSPKQEKWIGRNRHLLKAHVAIGIGGSLEFLAKSIQRAPAWMQEYSLEWLYRMWQEPRRLAPRYYRDAVWVGRNLPRELIRNLAGRRRYSGLRLSISTIGAVQIIRVDGAMTGSELPKLGHILSEAVVSSGPVVLDMAGTGHIGADGLWTLAGLLRKATKQGCELWLTGLSPSLLRTLRGARFEGLINSAASALDAVRQISRGRLQINLELGENWATCRIVGDISPAVQATLEQICQSIRMTNQHFEFDASGVTDFDPSHLLTPVRPSGRVVYVDAPHIKAAGLA
jgi:N-acetylglucosaminyldiphosphoundecaprenol N-acetyl-beta-D-mannosaminyltransferase